MPYIGEDFPNATIGETITYFVDMSTALAPDETIVRAIVTASVAPDSLVNDPNAASIVDGIASIHIGGVIGQRFTGMVLGVKYLIQFSAITDQGNVIIPFAHFFTDEPT